MTTHIGTKEIRQRLGEILDRVALRNDQYVIERKGKPLAVLMPVEKAEALERAARLHLLEFLDRAKGAGTEEQIARLADTAKHKTRPK
jgi:prevent-host-death family protein